MAGTNTPPLEAAVEALEKLKDRAEDAVTSAPTRADIEEMDRHLGDVEAAMDADLASAEPLAGRIAELLPRLRRILEELKRRSGDDA